MIVFASNTEYGNIGVERGDDGDRGQTRFIIHVADGVQVRALDFVQRLILGLSVPERVLLVEQLLRTHAGDGLVGCAEAVDKLRRVRAALEGEDEWEKSIFTAEGDDGSNGRLAQQVWEVLDWAEGNSPREYRAERMGELLEEAEAEGLAA